MPLRLNLEITTVLAQLHRMRLVFARLGRATLFQVAEVWLGRVLAGIGEHLQAVEGIATGEGLTPWNLSLSKRDISVLADRRRGRV